eukprot:CAMPEP_0194064258 /NCGR_PEP_ID=MMETSP0009_2-20130614/82520_1 /TAXON_ID=210454 /ORGANISM="Grammatophora oceanica, Strain CCMP 410" /LENGTH=57 /DNA_ID=CAMNT_0038716671 /DNA_START=249 /DNA_END=422 /DNA_ORIENTATION=-
MRYKSLVDHRSQSNIPYSFDPDDEPLLGAPMERTWRRPNGYNVVVMGDTAIDESITE